MPRGVSRTEISVIVRGGGTKRSEIVVVTRFASSTDIAGGDAVWHAAANTATERRLMSLSCLDPNFRIGIGDPQCHQTVTNASQRGATVGHLPHTREPGCQGGTRANPFRSRENPLVAFEVRGVHRRRKRFQVANPLRNQREECTTGG